MHDWRSLSHVRWECKYHVVIIPKYRKKVFYGKSRERIGEILRDLCKQRGIELIEGHARADHIHMCLSIPPKYSVSNTVGFLKGKSAVRIHRELQGQRRMTGLHFWATGYCVSAVGLDEETIRRYIREQDELQRRKVVGWAMPTALDIPRQQASFGGRSPPYDRSAFFFDGRLGLG